MEKRNYCIFSETLKGRLTRSSRSHVMVWYFAAFKPRPNISTREALQILWALQPYQIYVISMILKCTICRMSGVIATTTTCVCRSCCLRDTEVVMTDEQCAAGGASPAAHWCLAPPPAMPATTYYSQPPRNTHVYPTPIKIYCIPIYLQYIHYIVCESPIYCSKGTKLLKRRLSLRSRVSAD